MVHSCWQAWFQKEERGADEEELFGDQCYEMERRKNRGPTIPSAKTRNVLAYPYFWSSLSTMNGRPRQQAPAEPNLDTISKNLRILEINSHKSVGQASTTYKTLVQHATCTIVEDNGAKSVEKPLTKE